MRVKSALLGTIFLLSMAVIPASATTITAVTQAQLYDVTGEVLSYTFAGLPASDGGSVTLTIATEDPSTTPTMFWGIDLASMTGDKNFTISADGIYSDTLDRNVLGAASSGSPTDYTFNFNLLGFTTSTLMALIADGSVTFLLDFSDGVTAVGIDEDSIRLTLIYSSVATVPAPAALPLLASGLGAIGFIGWRRKRKDAA